MAQTVGTAKDITALIGERNSSIRQSGGAPSVVHRLLGAWRRRRHYLRTVAELSALSDERLADIGVLRGQIRSLARHLADQKVA